MAGTCCASLRPLARRALTLMRLGVDYFCGKGAEALKKIIERREPETLHEVGCENTAGHLVWRLLLADLVSVNTNISPEFWKNISSGI